MTTFDLRPLFHSTVGFDRMMDMLDTAMTSQLKPTSYPPYNIIKLGEDTYKIVMAVAGFSSEDITVTVQENNLLIAGSTEKTEQEEAGVEYLHKGIAARSFEKSFRLADFIHVQGVGLENGLLTLHLQREIPEESKPRQIPINEKTSKPKMIDAKKQ